MAVGDEAPHGGRVAVGVAARKALVRRVEEDDVALAQQQLRQLGPLQRGDEVAV